MKKNKKIIGIDEVGYGAGAGPVVSAAVILDGREFEGLDDSKKLSPRAREVLYWGMIPNVKWGVASISNDTIDQVGVVKATEMSMVNAVESMSLNPTEYHIKIDGIRTIPIEASQETIVKGDTLVPEIMAASIIAKVYRDNLMTSLSNIYPLYGWDQNKGYLTRQHIQAIKEHGLTPLHRRVYCERFLEK